MPKGGRNLLDYTSAPGTVWFISCSSCGWSCSRRYEDEAHAAAAVHEQLKHSVLPTTARPTW
jgi:hypothetical protein